MMNISDDINSWAERINAEGSGAQQSASTVPSKDSAGSPETVNANSPQAQPTQAAAGLNQAGSIQSQQTSADVERWATQINQAIGFSTGWKIKVGKLLNNAKRDLKGQWVLMFSMNLVRFGLRSAEMYMAIGRSPALSHSQYLANLPAALTTLYVLAQMSPEAIERAIASGEIHSDLRAAEARHLVQAHMHGGTVSTTPARDPFDVQREKACLLRYLRSQRERWPAAHHEELTGVLESAATELRAKNSKL